MPSAASSRAASAGRARIAELNLTPEQASKICQARKKVVMEVAQQLLRELEQVRTRVHPEYLRLGAAMNATRLRLLSMAELEYQLSVQHAKHTLDYAKQQIENDFLVGMDDIQEKLYADLRRRKRELRELEEEVSTLLAEGEEPLRLPEIKIPVRKRRGDRSGPVRGRRPEEGFSLKTMALETKQDVSLIRSLVDQKG